MRRYAGLAATVSVICMFAITPAQAHTPEPSSRPGHGPTIGCDEAKMLTSVQYFGAGPEGLPYKTVCLRKINDTAWVVRSWHHCFCIGNGTHDTTVNYDLRHNGWAAYDDRTWFTSRHVG